MQDRDMPPWLQPVPEDEEPQGGFFNSRKKLIASAAFAVTAVALFIAVVLYLYRETDTGAPRHIPAEAEPFREKPSDPGGMDVPYQDKEIFEQANGSTVRQPAALGDQPEEPLSELPKEAVQSEPGSTHVQEPVREAVKVAVPEAQKTEPKPEPKKADTAPKVTVKGFKVQLGAYGSEETAAKAWREIKGKYPEILGGMNASYEAVRSGDRTLYRLRVGPMENRAAADEVCLGLRARQQACIVVNP